MRQQGNVPSSVISSHSMHLGVLATAWHAIMTKTMFTVYYKPRFGLNYVRFAMKVSTYSKVEQLIIDFRIGE